MSAAGPPLSGGSTAFTWRKDSQFPLLERAFAEVLRSWAARVKLTQLTGSPASQAVADAANELLAACERDGRSLDGNLYPNSQRLFVRSDASWTNDWAQAVGSRFRRVAQESLESPTNVGKFDPAGYVVILGAGASAHASLPMTNEILTLVKQNVAQRAPSCHNDLLIAIGAIPSNDFEEVIGSLQTIAWSRRAFRQQRPREDEWVRQLLISYKSVLLDAQFERRGSTLTRDFIAKLVKESNGKWAIVSFNQDSTVEYELKDMRRWKPEDGFGGHLAGDVNATLPPYRVYKPHGSVALHRPHAWPLRGLKLDDRAFERKMTGQTKSRNVDENWAPLILPPSFLKVYVDDFITNMMARLAFEIIHARHVLVVGFRLRPDDLTVSNVIRYAFRENRMAPLKKDQRTFTVVGPGARSFAHQESLGSAWAPTVADLAAKGWQIELRDETFERHLGRSKLF